jgi:hypothetical protein
MVINREISDISDIILAVSQKLFFIKKNNLDKFWILVLEKHTYTGQW